MANNASASKRILINNRNRLRNRFYKSTVRTLTKLFLKQIEISKSSQNIENKKTAQNILKLAYSLIDKGCKKKVFHKNTAARKKSQLALALKSI
jgi:small subunit ribosomal protein S20